MWTPRRILLLVVGAGLFTAAFLLYNRFLGWIDGLPSLPDRYLTAAKPGDAPIEPRGKTRLIQKLQQAFDDGCPEARYNYQMELQAQGLVIAFQQIDFDPGGDVLVKPLSIAWFGKINPKTGYSEINTVRCDRARIKFTHPVKTYADIGRSKVVAADFFSEEPTKDRDSRICLVHNHGTPQAGDDMHIKMRGPVHFKENPDLGLNKPHLWTDHGIEVTDYQADPAQAHWIKADKLRLFLATDRDQKKTSGVRRLELHQVEMQLTVDKSSDFLAPASAPPARDSGSRAKLWIRTQGKFDYDVHANNAEFIAGEKTTYLPQYVEVVHNQVRGSDELRCDKLKLEFKPKSASTARDSTNNLGLTEVRATGPKVVVIAPSDQLSAFGTELVFRQDKREVVLSGAPMMAVKGTHRIEAPELYLHRPDPNRPAPPGVLRLGRAPGPGTMYLHQDKTKDTVEVRWKDELLIEREGTQDRVTLSGRAVFDDRANNQWLSGDHIRIWMLPTPSTAKPDSTSARPERLRVAGRVEARTPELTIDNTPLLDVIFQDVEQPFRTPDTLAPNPAVPSRPIRPQLGAPDAVASTPVSTQPPKKKPVHLSAGYIETIVHRYKDHQQKEHLQLDHVGCRTRVRVKQAAEKLNQRGLDVRADTMTLTHFLHGDKLKLGGTLAAPAHVEINQLTFEGPIITVDRGDSHVEVLGAGNAVLQTSSKFNGEKLATPTDVVIQWRGRMDFRGNRISFYGGVQADQEEERTNKNGQSEHEVNRLLCPRMDIYLDRTVSFNQDLRPPSPGSRGDDGPGIKRVVCRRGDESDPDRLVTIAGNLWRNGQRVRFQQIDAPEVTFENDTREVTATCTERSRGEMRIWSNAGMSLDDETPARSSAEQVFKLTHVTFHKQMRANDRVGQSLTFTGSVRAWHAPSDDPQQPVNHDIIPEKGFTLACQSLELGTHVEGKKHYVWMSAEGKADITAKDFHGLADKIKYDEFKKKQIIFDSSDGNPAALYHIKEKGKPPMEVLGRQIIYWWQTNDFRGSGLVSAAGAK